MITKEQITTIKERIVSAVKPQRIYLFGSYASGKEHNDSDLDFLVVVPVGAGKKNDVVNAIEKELGFSQPVAKDFVVEYSDRFDRFKDIPYSFIGHIVQTGKLLYES